MTSRSSIDDLFRFWEKMKVQEISEEAIDIYLDRLMNEAEDSMTVSKRMVENYSFSQISYFCYFNFVVYIFVSIFRNKIDMHVIEDVFLAVWNSKEKRRELKDRITIEFIRKVSQSCKNINH